MRERLHWVAVVMTMLSFVTAFVEVDGSTDMEAMWIIASALLVIASIFAVLAAVASRVVYRSRCHTTRIAPNNDEAAPST